jgi:very-short-patch-repair endonuclease
MKSELELLLSEQIAQDGLPVPKREHRFALSRLWRFDFAWPEYKLAVEIDGGTWSGGSHVRGKGVERDCEKRNAAVMDGWRILRYTGDMVNDGRALEDLKTWFLNRSAQRGPDSYTRAEKVTALWLALSEGPYHDSEVLMRLIAREIRAAVDEAREERDAKPSAHDACNLFASALQSIEPGAWEARFSSVLDDLDDGSKRYEMFLRDLAYEIGERLKRLER